MDEVGGSSLKKVKFRYRDVYDRSNTMKKFIYFNTLRNQNELDENFEILERNSEVRDYLMISQGQYSRMLVEAIHTYVTKDSEFTRTSLRVIKNPCPRSILENSNPVSLVFKDYYKFNNRNPMSDVFDARLGGINYKLDKMEQEKRLQRENFKKLVSIEKEKLRKKKGILEELSDDDDDEDSGNKTPTFTFLCSLNPL